MVKINVASICKNEEDMIRPWLEHLLSSDYITGIYLNDTGSTDRTIEYIKSYNDKRIHLYQTTFTNFSEARNFVLSKLPQTYDSWFIQLDIDELFNHNMTEGLDVFDSYTRSARYEGSRAFVVPHIKMFDFNRIWFHKPPTAPSWDGNQMIYSWQKDTMTFFQSLLLRDARYNDILHERLHIPSHPIISNVSILNKEILTDLTELYDDFFIIHYSKAKLHAEAKRTGKSFEYCVGKKRREYRLLKPAVTNGKIYDRDWALRANEAEIEQLGKDQLTQFIDIEGHVFPSMPFDPYTLNNDYVRKYF